MPHHGMAIQSSVAFVECFRNLARDLCEVTTSKTYMLNSKKLVRPGVQHHDVGIAHSTAATALVPGGMFHAAVANFEPRVLVSATRPGSDKTFSEIARNLLESDQLPTANQRVTFKATSTYVVLCSRHTCCAPV